jgi:hypothetical protein
MKTFATKDYINDYVCIDDDLDTYPKHLIMKIMMTIGGIIYGVAIVGDYSVSISG